MTHSGFVLGVDGCRQGWVGVVLPVEEAAGDPRGRVGTTLAALAEDAGPVAGVGVDMPLHLTDDPWRARPTWPPGPPRAEGCHPVRHAARLRLRGGRLRRGLRRRPRAHGQRLQPAGLGAAGEGAGAGGVVGGAGARCGRSTRRCRSRCSPAA